MSGRLHRERVPVTGEYVLPLGGYIERIELVPTYVHIENMDARNRLRVAVERSEIVIRDPVGNVYPLELFVIWRERS
jgi:hypothetical protein